MEKTEVISVNSSPPVTINSSSESAIVLRYVYKEANCNMTPNKLEKASDKPSSSSTERVPVSWSSRKYNVHTISTNKTPRRAGASPSPKTKVTNWLNKKGNWSQVSVVKAPPRFVTEYKKTSAILARHDFNKTFTITDCKAHELSPISSCTSPQSDSEVLERHNIFHIKTNCPPEQPGKPGGFEIENTVPPANATPPINNLANTAVSEDYNIFVKKPMKLEENCEADIKQEIDTNLLCPQVKLEVACDTPLSPESQKKKELCSYLQLVNLSAANHKEIAPIQNRRSVRVKNNLLLTEKKELERKLNGESSKSEEIVGDEASKRSFQELFGDSNPLSQRKDVKTEEGIVGGIPREFLEKIEDFDDFVREFFTKEKMPMPKQQKPKRKLKKNRLISKWEPQKRTDTLNKRRIRAQFNKMFKKPVKKNGVYKLRKKKYKDASKNCLRSLRSRNLVRQNLLGEGSRKKNKLRTKRPTQRTNRKKKQKAARTVDVVMQDHDYICSDDAAEADPTGPQADPTGPQVDSTAPCHGFSSPERSLTSCETLNKLCLRLSDSIGEQLVVDVVTTTPDIIDPTLISPKVCEYIALDPEVKPKSLHRTLVQQRTRKRRLHNNTDYETDDSPNWDTDESPSTSRQNKYDKRYNLSHSICISKTAGSVVKAYYINFNLIIAQEFEVTFWSQSALGNILGAHNMWLPKGQVRRLVLDNGCVQKESREMVISLENSVAYVELWTKEHKSEKREMPVADVFAAVYFCRNRQNGVFKKVLQLENIKSSAEDVRYMVMQNSRNIVVSWRMVRGDEKRTIVHCYHLAADFQTVYVIKEVKSVEHYVSSLHSIEGCDDLIIGWGENMVTLWNLEYGYVIATVEILETIPLSSPLCVKCDRGFLFLLQQMENGNLCLIAINGLNQSWKRLQTFVPPQHFDTVTGVHLENGLLVAFFKNGVLAWHVNSGELRVEEENLNCDLCLSSGRHAIMFMGREVHVRHALTLLIASDDYVGTVDDH